MYMFSCSPSHMPDQIPLPVPSLSASLQRPILYQILLLFLLYPTSLYYCFNTQVMLFPLPKLKSSAIHLSAFIFPPVFKLYPVYHSKTSPTSSLGGCFSLLLYRVMVAKATLTTYGGATCSNRSLLFDTRILEIKKGTL